MKTLIFLFLFSFARVLSFAQTDDFSLSELKDAYFQKRTKLMHSSTKKFSETEQLELNKILDQIKEKDAASYEFHLITYVNGNYDLTLKENLFKAYSLNPTDKTVINELFGYYIMTDNLTKQKEFATKILKDYTAAELTYYKDAMPKETNAILLTSNQEDSHAFQSLQLIDGIGSGIKIVNLDFLKNETYKESITTFAETSNTTFLGSETNFVKTLITGSTKKIHISTTVSQAYLSNISDKIFLTGLTYQYGTIDQKNALDIFWTSMKTKDFSKLILSRTSEKNLYANYLPPLLTLYKIKKAEKKDDITLKTTIQTIADKIGKKDAVDQILAAYETDE